MACLSVHIAGICFVQEGSAEMREKMADKKNQSPVSYTHLTLPTTAIV